MRILISAGEASGEMYGAQLMEELRSELSGKQRAEAAVEATNPTSSKQSVVQSRPQDTIEFFGVGGEKMRAAGCDTVVDAKDLAVVGITEILNHLPKIWRLFHQLIEEADRRRPDLAIVIDSPAFNWRVARQMKKRAIPVVYYVCPQFWAWRQGRVKLLRKYVDKALVIFPFEEIFYRNRGVDAEFIGHPLAELSRPAISRPEYAARFELDPTRQWVTIMPGSRRKEVRMNLPGILEAAGLLSGEFEFLLPVAPTLDEKYFQPFLGPAEKVRERVHLVPEALPALAHSRAGVIASGTATVEAALMGLPFVMVYRVTPMTYLLGKSAVKVPYFAMVNLMAGEKIVPELVQRDFTPVNVAAEVNKIVADGNSRDAMLQGLQRVKTGLKGSNLAISAPARAAAAIRALLGR
ncbi:MAG TPA: lipid-A-disaccharide synthase [Terriglobales bacterium]|nr:lipid-A-disaccharide synthase [Terriglobales bacterium]